MEEQLSEGQIKAIESVKSGDNVFITGPGGVGKSFVMQQIRKDIQGITFTGSTGIAAVNIGGRTLHNFLGLGLGEDSAEEIYKKILIRKNVINRIRQCKTMVIDEISMIDGVLLDKCDQIMRLVRRSDKPFGGVQVIAVGDFLQLPPVRRENGFAFESKVWKRANFKTVYLNKVFRQKNPEFVEHLMDIRMGNLTKESIEYFESRVGKKFEGDIEPVEIYTINRDVDKINTQKLAALNTESRTYAAFDEGHVDAVGILDKNCPAAKSLTLKKDCQVVLLANLNVEEGFVNGSVGKVIGFLIDGTPIVKFKNGKTLNVEKYEWTIEENKKVDLLISTQKPIYRKEVIASRKQIPLRVCYAITTHRAQGSTLDCAKINLSNIFEYALAYVALSRVKDIESLFVVGGINWEKVRAHPKAVAFYKNAEEGKDPTFGLDMIEDLTGEEIFEEEW